MNEAMINVCAKLVKLGFNPYMQVNQSGQSSSGHFLIHYHDLKQVEVVTAKLVDGNYHAANGRKHHSFLAIYNPEDSSVTIVSWAQQSVKRNILLDGSDPFKDGIAYRS